MRVRARDDGDAVALSPAFRETLDRHGALMKQPRVFRARPQAFERLLADFAGIGQLEIKELGEAHARASSYPRSVAGKATQSPQSETEQLQELAQADVPVETPASQPDRVAEVLQTGEGEPLPAWPVPTEPRSSRSRDHSDNAYRQFRIDWQRHAARAERSGTSPFDLDGVAALFRRIGEFPRNENLAAEPRRRLQNLVNRYTHHLEAGARLKAWLEDADKHRQRYDSIHRRAHHLDVAPDTLPPFRNCQERNEQLLRRGTTILDDPGAYGVRLDRFKGARKRVRDASSMQRLLHPLFRISLFMYVWNA